MAACGTCPPTPAPRVVGRARERSGPRSGEGGPRDGQRCLDSSLFVNSLSSTSISGDSSGHLALLLGGTVLPRHMWGALGERRHREVKSSSASSVLIGVLNFGVTSEGHQ